MCKAIRQRLRMKVYLCYIAKYSLIHYLNTTYEKDYRNIFIPVGSRSFFYILCTIQKGLSNYQSQVFQVLVFLNKWPDLVLKIKEV